MRILVMSDTHSDAQIIDAVAQHVHIVDAKFHCGDSELLADAAELANFYTVRGNCDSDANFLNDRLEMIDDTKIFMTHGHLYNVKNTLTPLMFKAREVAADIVLFGHSHVLGAEFVDGTLFVNPGSLKAPRGRSEKTYAIIEKTASHYVVTFYDEQHMKVEEVQFLY